jgi:hypothetical protein
MSGIDLSRISVLVVEDSPFIRTLSVNSLLSLQEMPTSTEGRSKGIQRAEGLIEHLEAIRHGLLLGHISKDRLGRIIKALAAEREKNLDPGLIQVINDIELRAKVELAKLEYLG